VATTADAIPLIVISSVGRNDELRFQIILDKKKASPSFSLRWRSSAHMFFRAVLCWTVSIFGTHFAQTFL
jgi:hypothetical protein